ncbi:hypothetical protein FA10DRAFT_283697 [Acaromyces ingoldii]|uniref:Uncharacterized protein n=1 Tax=Acaromyces ingoldii TaxID=215250 RepID=A0A316YX38_9BASI|nr:hypothetical protein FA10DRAFT_283697 [Acaromyces ingoldii]PWN94090.1 hypothetical protein FA10DRAFT_283697 [Acaromyces ingoldii]
MVLFRTFLRQHSLRTGITVLSLLSNVLALSILTYKLLGFLAAPAHISLSPFTRFWFFVDVCFLASQPILSLYGHFGLSKRYYPAVAAFRSWTLFFFAMRLFAGGFSIVGYMKDDRRWMAACTREWKSTGEEDHWKILGGGDDGSHHDGQQEDVAAPAYWCHGRFLSHVIALSFLWVTDVVVTLYLFLCIHSYKRIYFITEEEEEAHAYEEELYQRRLAEKSRRRGARQHDAEVQDGAMTEKLSGGGDGGGGGGDTRTVFRPPVSPIMKPWSREESHLDQVMMPIVKETPPTPESSNSAASTLTW